VNTYISFASVFLLALVINFLVDIAGIFSVSVVQIIL